MLAAVRVPTSCNANLTQSLFPQTERLFDKAAADLHSRPWFPTSAFGSAGGTSNVSNAEWASGAAFSSPLARSNVVYKAERPLQSPEPAHRASSSLREQRERAGSEGDEGGSSAEAPPRRSGTPPPPSRGTVQSDTPPQPRQVPPARPSTHTAPPPARQQQGAGRSAGYSMAAARGGHRQRGMPSHS